MYGIEGVHYEVIEKGAVTNGQDRINYPDGLDATTTTYRKSGTWLMPNQFIGDIWGTDLPADYWDVTKKFNEESQKVRSIRHSPSTQPRLRTRSPLARTC